MAIKIRKQELKKIVFWDKSSFIYGEKGVREKGEICREMTEQSKKMRKVHIDKGLRTGVMARKLMKTEENGKVLWGGGDQMHRWKHSLSR